MFFAKGEIIMNNIYKVIWSKAKNCYVVASEIARSHTKSASGSEKIGGVTRRSLLASLMALSLLCGGLGVASAADSTVHVDASTTPSNATEVYTTTGVNTLLADYGKKEDVQNNKNNIANLQTTTIAQGQKITENTTNIANNKEAIDKKIDKETADATYATKEALNNLTTTVNGKADLTALEGKADKTYVDQKFTEAGTSVETKLGDYYNKADVDGKITAEENARNTAINTAITQERNDRTTAIDTAINGEVAARTQAINTAITQEVTARDLAVANAKTDLQHNITAEETARKEADTAFNTRLTTAEGKIGANETAIGDLKAADTALEGEITKNREDIATLNGKVATAEGNITDLKAKDTDLEKKIQTNADNIQTNSKAIADTNKRTGGIARNDAENKTIIEKSVTVDSKGNVTADGKLKAGSVDAGDGAITTTGAVNAGSLNVTNGATSLKETTVNGKLTAKENATFEKNVTVEKDLTVDGKLNVGEIYMKNDTHESTGKTHDSATAITADGISNLAKVTDKNGNTTESKFTHNEEGTFNYAKEEKITGEWKGSTSNVTADGVSNKMTDSAGNKHTYYQTATESKEQLVNGDKSNFEKKTAEGNTISIKDKDAAGNDKSLTNKQTVDGEKTSVTNKESSSTINQGADQISNHVTSADGKKSSTEVKADGITNTSKDGTITNDAKDIVNNATGNMTNTVGADLTTTVGGNELHEVTGTKIENVTGKVTENYKAGQETNVTGDQDIYVTGKQTNKIDGDQENTIGGDQTTTVEGKVTENYGNGQETNVTGDQYIHVTGKQTNKIDGDQENTIDGSQTTTVTGDISNTAENITNEANTKLTDKVGDNTRVLDSEGITDTVPGAGGKGSTFRQRIDAIMGNVKTDAGESEVTQKGDEITSEVGLGEATNSRVTQKKDSLEVVVTDGTNTTSKLQTALDITNTAKDGTITNDAKDIVNNASGNMTNTVGGDLKTTVSGNELHEVTGTKTENVTGKVTENYKAGQETNVTGDQDIYVTGKQTNKIDGDQENTIGGSQTTTVTGDISNKAENITNEANTKLTDKVGDHTRVLDSEGITDTVGGSTFKQRIDKIMMESKDVSIKAEETLTNEAKVITNKASEDINNEAVNINNTATGIITSKASEIKNQADKLISNKVGENTLEKMEDGKITTSITKGTKANTVISTVDGTRFENSEAAAPVTGASGAGTAVNTTIKGNTITTGKVTMDYAEVMKDLGVHGSATVDNDLTVKGITNTKTLNVTEDASVGRDLAVGGNATIKGDVTARSYNVGGNTYIDADGIHANNQKITDVADGSISEGSKDAVNGGQLYGVKRDLEHQVDKVGANAAAMANLRPMEFDPSSKWNIAAAIGNYGSETAAALGAFYRPNDNVMVNLSTAFGTGENMVGGGVSVRLGKGGNKLSREETNALKAQVADLTARMDALLSVLNPNMSKDFPDVPENHWAYEAVSRLAGNDIVQGYPDGEFHGERTMTRYEMAEIIYNALSRGAEAEKELVEEFKPELQAMAASEKATAERAEG